MKIAKYISLILLFGFLCSCVTEKSKHQSQLVGCYRSTDASLYNSATLVLYKSNKYTIKTEGDIGRWGEIYGAWRHESNEIHFTPKNKPKHRIQPNPSKLIVVTSKNELYLAHSNQQKINEYSSSGWTSFKKQECNL